MIIRWELYFLLSVKDTQVCHGSILFILHQMFYWFIFNHWILSENSIWIEATYFSTKIFCVFIFISNNLIWFLITFSFSDCTGSIRDEWHFYAGHQNVSISEPVTTEWPETPPPPVSVTWWPTSPRSPSRHRALTRPRRPSTRPSGESVILVFDIG